MHSVMRKFDPSEVSQAVRRTERRSLVLPAERPAAGVRAEFVLEDFDTSARKLHLPPIMTYCAGDLCAPPSWETFA